MVSKSTSNFKIKMNKDISNIKIKINKALQNPKVRQGIKITIALIIIGAIMTGAAFGLMALMRSINDPCANQPNKVYKKEIKMCVDKDCQNICTADGDMKGVCLDNYCNYTDTSGNPYTADTEDCACQIVCPDDQEGKNLTNPDINYTQMSQKDPTDPKSQYFPVDKLVCTKECKFSDKGYCLPNKDCQISIGSNGEVLNSTGEACDLSKNGAHWQQCADPNVVCNQDSNQEIVYSCTEAEASSPITNQYGTFTSYCTQKNFCDSPNDKVICVSNDDCKDSSGAQGDCVPNKILSDKGFLYIKTCENSDKLNPNDGNITCTDINLVGENKIDVSTNPNPKLKDVYHQVTTKKNVGISLNQPQCDITSSAECSTDELKGWFCNISDGCKYSINGSSLKECDTTKPPITTTTSTDKIDLYCCKNTFTQEGINGCCPTEPISGKCLNTSAYSPDSNWLKVSDSVNFTCNNDSDCTKYNSSLYEALNISQTEAEDSTNGNYSSMYCDKTDKICKFYAGYIEKIKGDSFDGNNFIVGNDVSKKESIATLKSKNITFFTPDYKCTTGNAKIPFCALKDDSDPDNSCLNKNKVFGIYNNGEPQTPTSSYVNNVSVSYKTTGAEPNILDCLNHAKDEQYFITDNKDGSINYHSIQSSNIGSGTCNYMVDCKTGYNSTVTNTSKKAYPLPWNFSAGEIQTDIADDTNSPIKFVGIPVDNGIDRDSCYYVSDMNNCTSIKEDGIYSSWKGQLTSPCKIEKSTDGEVEVCVNKTNNNLSSGEILPQYDIATGSYCKNGFTFNGSSIHCN